MREPPCLASFFSFFKQNKTGDWRYGCSCIKAGIAWFLIPFPENQDRRVVGTLCLLRAHSVLYGILREPPALSRPGTSCCLLPTAADRNSDEETFLLPDPETQTALSGLVAMRQDSLLCASQSGHYNFRIYSHFLYLRSNGSFLPDLWPKTGGGL